MLLKMWFIRGILMLDWERMSHIWGSMYPSCGRCLYFLYPSLKYFHVEIANLILQELYEASIFFFHFFLIWKLKLRENNWFAQQIRNITRKWSCLLESKEKWRWGEKRGNKSMLLSWVKERFVLGWVCFHSVCWHWIDGGSKFKGEMSVISLKMVFVSGNKNIYKLTRW